MNTKYQFPQNIKHLLIASDASLLAMLKHSLRFQWFFRFMHANVKSSVSIRGVLQLTYKRQFKFKTLKHILQHVNYCTRHGIIIQSSVYTAIVYVSQQSALLSSFLQLYNTDRCMAAANQFIIYVHYFLILIGFTCIGKTWGCKGIDVPSIFFYL